MTDPEAMSSWWVAPSTFLVSQLCRLYFLLLNETSLLRTTTEGIFSLKDELPKPRPRAWERAPKSPVLARHHGHKVWKRFEAPAKPVTEERLRDDKQTRQALGDATNAPRPVKRLRLKDAAKVENKGKENKAAQYFATLCDQENSGTPRRKLFR